MADELMKVDQQTGEIVASAGISIEETRAQAESQAGFVVAKRFPRNQELAVSNIMRACESVRLAEEAEYSYPKGNTTVQGPTIRLLEVIAQNWGNIISGVREVEVREDDTLMMAYAYDLETNRRAERAFTVPNFIMLKGGGRKYLDDPRELYELRANMGSRRERACLERVIPRHIIDEAVDACRLTVATKGTPATPENIQKMIDAFGAIGVDETMLEMRQGKKLKALTGPELAALRRIYKGIDEGITTVDKVFGDKTLKQPQEKQAEKEEKEEKPKKKATKKKKKPAPKAETPAEEPAKAESRPEDGEQADAGTGDSEGSNGDLPLQGELETQGDDLPTITDRIAKVEFSKEGQTKTGSPYSLYYIHTDGGEKMACFNKELIEQAEEAAAERYLCELEIHKSKFGIKLMSLEVLG